MNTEIMAMTMAVDSTNVPSSGNIYVTIPYGNKPDKLFGFDKNGNNLGGNPRDDSGSKKSCGVTVDSNGHIWIGDDLNKPSRSTPQPGCRSNIRFR